MAAMIRWVILREIPMWVGAAMCLSCCSPPEAEPSPTLAHTSSASAMQAAPPADTRQRLDCAHPFQAMTSAEELTHRVGASLRLTRHAPPEAVFNPEGPEELHLRWWDERRTALESVTVNHPNSLWRTPQGLHIGSSLSDVEFANGKPFRINGFGWEYGGYLIAGTGDRLATMEGGCVLHIRMGKPDAPTAAGPGAQGNFLLSSDPEVRRFAPVVTEITVSWSLPEGMTPAAQPVED